MNRSYYYCFLASFVFVTSIGCNNSTTNTAAPSPTTPAPNGAVDLAKKEDDFENETDDEYKMRAEVRQVVADFVKARLPNWSLKGISSQLYQSNIFWSAADIEKDGHSVVINLAVRKFFPDSGDPYWKVVSLQKTLQEQLQDMNDAEAWKRLNEANSSSAEEGDSDPR